MSERSSFFRKVVYGVAVAVLLFPLALLSAPATRTDAGGKLARLRSEHGLSQADLGEVDPASETIKLATLGLRGIAVNLLWEKANYYKKTEDWTNLTATLEQLAKLQPNFITFWKFQAWNLSYNVSVEFDDYHDRYYYVRRGIEFLQEGERYNRDNPSLLSDLGWFIGQKIGRADEHVQYRRLFKTDDDYHPADRTPDERDNWLVGKEWYLKAIDAVDNRGKSLGRKSPRIFYSSPSMSQINYSEAIEEEGAFEKARRAWVRASEEWRQFGQRVLEHSTGVKLQLGTEPQLEKEVTDLQARLDGLMPGVREQLESEKQDALSAEEQKLLAAPPESLTEEQSHSVYLADQKLEVTHREVAERIAREQPNHAREALQLATDLDRVELRLRYTRSYKQDSNYDFWETRCAVEQTPDALAARDLMFRGRQAFRDADLTAAKKLYEEGFAKWRLVTDKFPVLLENDLIVGDDLIAYVKQYRDVLDQLDETIGESFPLWEVIERFDVDQDFTDVLEEHHRRQRQREDPAGGEPAADAS